MTDVAIIGAGHNGLAAALTLAQAGRKVTVYERRAIAGGLCAPIEFEAGYTAPGVLHDTAFDPRLLGLSLDLRLQEPPPTWIAAGGEPRSVHRDLREVAGADAWRGFIDRVRGFARGVFSAPPPPLLPATTSDFWRLGKTGLGLRRLGRADMVELMRVPPMCAADWVHEHFEADPALAEFVAAAGVLHTFAGPWSAGTAANLLLAQTLAAPQVVGGPAALVSALETACRNAGVEIRFESPVKRIVVENGRATGVELRDGSASPAAVVLATCDPRTALLDLVAPAQLAMSFEQQLTSIRARGTTAKLMLALDGPLQLDGVDGPVERAYLGGGSVDALERAFDAVKYGEFSAKPVLDVWVPTVSTPALAPAGHHVVSVLASFVPYELRGGWTEEKRAELQETIVARLGAAAPSVRDRIVASALWTPRDIEAHIGVHGGCLHHVEHALDQLLFMRPTPSTAHYATPIAGLYLGGAGSHPCGGATGLPGVLAARTIKERT